MPIFAVAAPPPTAKLTVCTATVNSPDEREAFRRALPPGRFELVELVERGRADWLAESCRRGVQCDVLVVSGHFAGKEFYSSKPQVDETLPVAEIERAQCGATCSGLFARLREVYLFGCDTLKAEPVASAMPEVVRGLVRAGMPAEEAGRLARRLSVRHGEASRDLMRRLFPGVPVIYGFASLAPFGRVAGPMLERHFAAVGAAEVGSGVPSARLLAMFGPSSMVAERGLAPADPDADFIAEACLGRDERVATARRVEQLHARLAAPMPELRMAFEASERFLGGLSPGERGEADVARALAALAADAPARERYLAITRDTADPALRRRMIAVAREVGWLDAPGAREEHVRLVADLLDSPAPAHGEVDLACELNGDGALAGRFERHAPGRGLVHRALLACLGQESARGAVLEALASPAAADLHVARAYLRHHPLRDAAEARTVGLSVARMGEPVAQARSLEGLARLGVGDAEVLAALLDVFARTRSREVQSAVAEVFLRAQAGAFDAVRVAHTVRRHRLAAGDPVVEALLARLQPPLSVPASTQTKTPEPS